MKNKLQELCDFVVKWATHEIEWLENTGEGTNADDLDAFIHDIKKKMEELIGTDLL